jgi:hypothetical protein
VPANRAGVERGGAPALGPRSAPPCATSRAGAQTCWAETIIIRLPSHSLTNDDNGTQLAPFIVSQNFQTKFATAEGEQLILVQFI